MRGKGLWGRLGVLAPALAAIGWVAQAPTVAIAEEAADASYESLARGAVKTQDIATLLLPFVEVCSADLRDLDRIRCRATTAYLHQELPRRTFSTQSNDPAAIEVTSYDAAVK